jgi:two-component system, cell cycle response regulator DivK
MHGRRVWLESHLGKGSTFRVGFPVDAYQCQAGCRMMKRRILIVEDQEDLRAILRDLLNASGYETVEAVDGIEGVARAQSERRDLVLMDIQLPVLDGYEAIRKIKADPGLKSTPVIAVSSYAMKGDEEKARASGCDSYITKPYSPMQLLSVIRGFLKEQS